MAESKEKKSEKDAKAKAEAKAVETRLAIRANSRGLVLQNLSDMFRFAQYVVASRIAPSSFSTAEQVIIAIQSGAELGMPPMRSLGSYCVVKGQARLWGDAPLALVRQSGNLEYIKESIDGKIDKDLTKTADTVKAVCITKRKGDPGEVKTEFSVGEARRAGLWGKVGTWTTHPQRMLKYKARSFNLRDNFPDAMGGATIAEEFEGIEMTDAPLNDKPRSAELLKEPKEVPQEKPQAMTEAEVEAEAEKKFGLDAKIEYRCKDCGEGFDEPDLSEDMNDVCPECASTNIEKIKVESGVVTVIEEAGQAK